MARMKVFRLVEYLKKKIQEEKLVDNIIHPIETSNIILIKKPESEAMRKDWSLAEGGKYIHFVVMPWWEIEQIDHFIYDYKKYEKI